MIKKITFIAPLFFALSSPSFVQAAIVPATASATVTVTPGQTTAFLTANPISITLGQPSTLTWGSANASSCMGTGFSTGNTTSGSIVVTPSVPTTYSVICGASATATVTPTTSCSVQAPANNQMAVLNPCSTTLVTANQVSTPAPFAIAITDAAASVSGTIPITVQAPGMVDR